MNLPADAHWANVEITYSGRPGDLVPIAASYDKTDRYGLQSPFSDSVSFLWKGGMWHVDPTHGTLITTGNAGQTNARVAITLRYGQNGVYEIPYQAAEKHRRWLVWFATQKAESENDWDAPAEQERTPE